MLSQRFQARSLLYYAGLNAQCALNARLRRTGQTGRPATRPGNYCPPPNSRCAGWQCSGVRPLVPDTPACRSPGGLADCPPPAQCRTTKLSIHINQAYEQTVLAFALAAEASVLSSEGSPNAGYHKIMIDLMTWMQSASNCNVRRAHWSRYQGLPLHLQVDATEATALQFALRVSNCSRYVSLKVSRALREIRNNISVI